jgi:dTDP-4-dehydrorhamnose 3,5-epimerase
VGIPKQLRRFRAAAREACTFSPKLFEDSRGYFFESFSQKEFNEKVANINFVQDNESKSSYGVIRGLHFQKPPYAQSKLVRCVKGKVLDVAVDIREGSPTYGKWVSCELTEDNHRQFFIPQGFAHGFSVLSDEAVLQYKCDNFYNKDSEGAILWCDPQLNVNWKIYHEDTIISDKDSKNEMLKYLNTPFKMLKS